jgi:hypothetical protein
MISEYTVAGDTITYRVNAMNMKDVIAGHWDQLLFFNIS